MGRKRSGETRLARPKTTGTIPKNEPKCDQTTVLVLYSTMGCYEMWRLFWLAKICTKTKLKCTKNFNEIWMQSYKKKKNECKTKKNMYAKLK
jgi:hypothetical protein